MTDSIEMRAAREWEVIGNAIASLGRLHQEKLAQITGTVTPATPDSNKDSGTAVHTPIDSEQSGSTNAPTASQPLNDKTSMPAPNSSTSVVIPQDIPQESYGDFIARNVFGPSSKFREVAELAEKATINSHDALEVDGAAQINHEIAAHPTVATTADHNATPQRSSLMPVFPRHRLSPGKADGLDDDKMSPYIDRKHYDELNRPYARMHPAIFYDDAIVGYSLRAKIVPPYPNALERADALLPFGKNEKQVNLNSRKLGTASDHTDYFTYYLARDQNADFYSRLERSSRNPEVRGLDAIIEDLHTNVKTQSPNLDRNSAASDNQTTKQPEEAKTPKGKGKEKLKSHSDTTGSTLDNRGQKYGGDSRIKVHIGTPSPKKAWQATTSVGRVMTPSPTTTLLKPLPWNGGGRGPKSGLQCQGANSTGENRSKTASAAGSPKQTSPPNSDERGGAGRRQKQGGKSSRENSSNTRHETGTQTPTSSRVGSKIGSPSKASHIRTKGLSSSPKHWITPVIPRNYAKALQNTTDKANDNAGEMGYSVQNVTNMGGGARECPALSLQSSTKLIDIAKLTEDPKAPEKRDHPNTAKTTNSLGAPETERMTPAVQIATPIVKKPNINSIAAPSIIPKIKSENHIEESPRSPKTKSIAERAKETNEQEILETGTITEVASSQERENVPRIDMVRKAQTQSKNVVQNSSKVQTIVSTPEKNEENDQCERREAVRADSEGGKSTQAQTPETPNDPVEKTLSRSARKKRSKKQRIAEERQRKQEEEELLRAAAALSLEDRAYHTNGGDRGWTEDDEELPADSTPGLQLQATQARHTPTKADLASEAFFESPGKTALLQGTPPLPSPEAESKARKFLDDLYENPLLPQRQLSSQLSRNHPAITAEEHASEERQRSKVFHTGQLSVPPGIESKNRPRYFEGIHPASIDDTIKTIEGALENFLPGLQAASRPLDSLSFKDKEARLQNLANCLKDQLTALSNRISAAFATVRQLVPNYPAEPWREHSIEFKKEYLARLERVISDRKPKTKRLQADLGSVPKSFVQLSSVTNCQVGQDSNSSESLEPPPSTDTSAQGSQ